VWLRDYFWLAVAAWGILGSALYGFFSVAVVGVTRSAVSSCAISTVRD
jgi:hypothetical protein